MHTKEQLLEMHSEHNEWQNKIKFYRDEIKGLNNQLSEMVTKGISPLTLASIEHFQNQFILQNEHLDIMRHDFKQHENNIEAIQKGLPDTQHEALTGNHETHREKLDQFVKIFHDLRSEFNAFKTEATQMAF
jgi:uncharacterized coiled-coil DUF342 family protein